MKTTRFLSWIACGFLCLAALGCSKNSQASTTPSGATAEKDGVLVHITAGVDDVQRALMGLQMAALMAEDRPVLVYFDIEGVNLVLHDAPDVTHPEFPGSHEQLDKLAAQGVGLYACPSCLAVAQKSPNDLRAGVRVATKDAFFSFTKGHIITLDY